MCTIIKSIKFSVLSGGEQLVLSRLATKDSSGKQLTDRERRFITDMKLRGTRQKAVADKY